MNSKTLTINVPRPLSSASLLGPGDFSDDVTPQDKTLSDSGSSSRDTEAAAKLEKAAAGLKEAAEKLERFHRQMVSTHREAIARLSVEIARKILAQKVSDRDYEIESIIAEALNCAPTRQEVVIRLNPADLDAMQKSGISAQQFGSIQLVADDHVGCAECIAETPRGVVESMIEGHLEHVCRVLTNAE